MLNHTVTLFLSISLFLGCSDKMFPVYGFGAQIPPDFKVNVSLLNTNTHTTNSKLIQCALAFDKPSLVFLLYSILNVSQRNTDSHI